MKALKTTRCLLNRYPVRFLDIHLREVVAYIALRYLEVMLAICQKHRCVNDLPIEVFLILRHELIINGRGSLGNAIDAPF